MRLPKLEPATLLRRENRFLATVLLNGAHAQAHVANPGRLNELLVEGRRVWLAPASSPGRKTSHTLALVELEGFLVSVNAQLPNQLFREALDAGVVWPGCFPEIRTEVRRGSSRLDFMLRGPDSVRWVEVKSVTLVSQTPRGGLALFPDAPTDRGRRHLEELAHIVAGGEEAAVVFVVQRGDAVCMAPNDAMDLAFGAALREAAEAGVRVEAYTCRVDTGSIEITHPLPVLLDGSPEGASARL